MKIILTSAALSLAAGAALAGDKDFAKLDADKSGGLSLAEFNAAIADFTSQDLSAIDADRSGDISEAEFAAWKASKPKAEPSQPQ